MMRSAETPANTPWTVSLDRVREAALSIVSDADALDFTCAAITLGVPSREAGLLGEFIATTQMRAYGCIR